MAKLMAVYSIAKNQIIDEGGYYLSEPVNISRGVNFGVITHNISGTSIDYDVEYLVSFSEDGEYIYPTNHTIINGATDKAVATFTPVVAPYIKIKIVNNATNSLTIDLKLIVQEE